MSSVIAAPGLINTAATDLANIGSNLSEAHTAAAASTTGVIPAAADEVSASIAHLFSRYAQGYQALAGRAAAFHQQFMQNLTASAGSYASAEAANASLLHPLNAIAGSMGGVESRMGALLNALGHIPPGQFMHTPFLPGTEIENPFFGVPPGQVMHTEFIPGTGIKNPLFGVPPGHWNISQLIQTINMKNGAAAFHQPFLQPLNAIAGSMGGVESRMGALLNALEHIPPGQFMHTPFLPGTDIENPFFGVPPGQVMHTEFIPGTGIKNPLFGVPPGHWNISQLIQAINMNNGAAAFHQQLPLAASDMQGENQMNDLFFFLFFPFQIFEDLSQELAQLILLLLLL
jgi:hypothetical protein